MGWKNIKEHYRIEHIVHVRDGMIHIGSPLCPRILSITMDGELVVRDDNTLNEDLARYQAEMDADPEKLRELAGTPDSFGETVPVFVDDGAEILEKRCEVPGFPNCTTDGDLMTDDYVDDRAQAIRNAVEWNRWEIKGLERNLEETRKRLSMLEADMDKALVDKRKLAAMIAAGEDR